MPCLLVVGDHIFVVRRRLQAIRHHRPEWLRRRAVRDDGEAVLSRRGRLVVAVVVAARHEGEGRDQEGGEPFATELRDDVHPLG